MKIQTLGIIGVGFIGASIGLSVRRHSLAERVVGTDRLTDALERARSRGAIDEFALDPASVIARADVVIFCTPVDRIAAQVLSLGPLCRPGTLLTDAGSTKGAIVRAVEGRLPAGVTFVGSHPLAGSEKSGPEHARPDLFENRLVVVTPTSQTDLVAVERTVAFWAALGARVRSMPPEEHDRALAWTSHLPHLTASALAGVLPDVWRELTATGFRDTTRIAAGDPALWTAIFEQNRPGVLEALRVLESRLAEFRQALESGNRTALDALLEQGKRVRDALDP